MYVTHTSIFSTTYNTMTRNRCDKVIMTQAVQKKIRSAQKKKYKNGNVKFKKRQRKKQKRQRRGTRKYISGYDCWASRIMP
jgi:hypothetical protein